MRLELDNRIEATADVIRLLRINSVSESVDELVAIAEELKKLPEENSPSRLEEAGDKALSPCWTSCLLNRARGWPSAVHSLL
jgi:hypothetical protein